VIILDSRNQLPAYFPTVSTSTEAILSKYREYVGKKSLLIIKRNNEIEFSVSTLYAAFSHMRIPIHPMKLEANLCEQCNDEIVVLHPFYGSPHHIRCSSCHQFLKRLWIKRLPFYYPEDSDSFFNGQHLISVTSSEFKTTVEPHLGVWKKGYPLFQIDSDGTYHMIKHYEGWQPWLFCGYSIRRQSNLRFVSALSRDIPIKHVCRNCMMSVIDRWNQRMSLKPTRLDKKPSKREQAIKLFIDTLHLGSIGSACVKNKISRRTYYRYKDIYRAEFQTICGACS